MESVEFNLYPNIKKTITMVKIRYNVYEYKPFQYARIAIQYLDENDTPVENKVLLLDTTNGFNNWGSDDKFLETWIKSQILL
jgi:hypothetical protein